MLSPGSEEEKEDLPTIAVRLPRTLHDVTHIHSGRGLRGSSAGSSLGLPLAHTWQGTRTQRGAHGKCLSSPQSQPPPFGHLLPPPRPAHQHITFPVLPPDTAHRARRSFSGRYIFVGRSGTRRKAGSQGLSSPRSRARGEVRRGAGRGGGWARWARSCQRASVGFRAAQLRSLSSQQRRGPVLRAFW